MRRYNAIVVGLGGVGSAALYHLARRGLHVLGIDRFSPGHARGSSHGGTRIIRQAYFEHADYVPLVLRAWQLWEELSERRGEPMFAEVGLLQVGSAEGEVVKGVLGSARKHALEVEELTAADITRRWSGFCPPNQMVGAYERRAGYLHVERGVLAHIAEAVAAGAEVKCDRTVISWRGDGAGVVVSTDVEEICADKLVLAAGPWAAGLLADFAVRLEVLRKPVFWLATHDDTYRVERDCPCFLFELPQGIFYGVPQLDERGVKVAQHTAGDPVPDPLDVDRSLHADDQQCVLRFAVDCLPAADTLVRDHSVCMYTMTPDANFIIDHHPSFAQVIVIAGLSGHGFKFTPVLGEVAADLAIDGTTALPIDFLRMSRFH